MAETSRSQVTITLGRSGQVVKRAGPALDSSVSYSQPGVGSKRSIRDRLGSNVDENQVKRQRGAGSRLGLSAVNSMDDTRLRKDDLRFKIMRKNVLEQNQSNGQQNGVDLREMLSRPSQPSTSGLVRHRMPEPRDSKQHMLGSRDARQPMFESRDDGQIVPKTNYVRQPEPNNGSILGQIPSARTVDSLTQMDSLRKAYSPWTLDSLRRRSPDVTVGTSRGLSVSVPRNMEEVQRRPLIRTYDDVRTVPYISKDGLEFSRSMSTTSFMTKPSLPAGPAKPVAPLLAPPPRSGDIMAKSSYTVDDQLTVDSLLHSLGLEKYSICFKAEEVDMTVLRQMRDNDLKELGIPMGPRKKILLSLLSLSKRQM